MSDEMTSRTGKAWLARIREQVVGDFHTRPTAPNLRWLRRQARVLHIDSFGVGMTEEQAWTLSEQITAAADEIIRLRRRLRLRSASKAVRPYGSSLNYDQLLSAYQAQRQALVRARERLTALATGDYPPKRKPFPAKCPHGTSLEDDCSACMADYAIVALAEVEAALALIGEDDG